MFAILKQAGPNGLSGGSRFFTALAVIFLHVALGYLLLGAFGVDVVRTVESVLKVTNVEAEIPPVPQPKQPDKAEDKPTGKASAKNIKSKAAPKEAPIPKVKIVTPVSVVTTPKAGFGDEAMAGNSDAAGPGTGAGGQGDGSGAGGRGSGSGSAIAARAKHIAGKISNRDYPKGASRAKIGGVVTAYFTVLASGHVSRCYIKQSSGNAELDRTTCLLIEKRFRYRPARNRDGQPVEEKTGWQQTWWLETKGGSRVTH